MMEISKKEDPSANKTQFVIESAHLKTSNKQRTTILELFPSPGTNQPEQCLLSPSESEADIKSWFTIIDHALKNLPIEADSLNENAVEGSLSEAINDAVSSVSSIAGRLKKVHVISLFGCDA